MYLPIKHGDFPACHVSFPEDYRGYPGDLRLKYPTPDNSPFGGWSMELKATVFVPLETEGFVHMLGNTHTDLYTSMLYI